MRRRRRRIGGRSNLIPDFVAAYTNLGTSQYTDGEYHKAIETFQHGLQIDPLSGELYYGLGLALLRNGDPTAGIGH